MFIDSERALEGAQCCITQTCVSVDWEPRLGTPSVGYNRLLTDFLLSKVMPYADRRAHLSMTAASLKLPPDRVSLWHAALEVFI